MSELQYIKEPCHRYWEAGGVRFKGKKWWVDRWMWGDDTMYSVEAIILYPKTQLQGSVAVTRDHPFVLTLRVAPELWSEKGDQWALNYILEKARIAAAITVTQKVINAWQR